jgi:hypothetical protein
MLLKSWQNFCSDATNLIQIHLVRHCPAIADQHDRIRASRVAARLISTIGGPESFSMMLIR